MKRPASERLSEPPSQRLESGDIAPDCRLPDTSGETIHLRADSIAGNPLVLIFCPRMSERCKGVLESFSQNLQALTDQGARVYAINAEWDNSVEVNFPILQDFSGQAFVSFAVPRDRPSIVVLRRNYHVAAVLTAGQANLLDATLSILQSVAWERQTVQMHMHPPVLLIPDVFSREDCARLIHIFETRGQKYIDPQPIRDFLSGSDFKMRIPENGREDRVDHFFMEDSTLKFLDSRLNRVWPEIFKAFHYRITKTETLRVARYQGQRGGATHGHRDNNPPTPYRRFAMSINLNTPEFVGGELRFPEFGDQRYRPESGTAIVFSSSLLHEAVHVTEGRRYVLLGFLFGDI